MTTPHVVVIGGGPVGLSAAILLDRAGIACTVVERDERPSTHPKARGIRTRTMEIFAQWGLEEELRREALPPEANRFIYCDSVAGEEIGRSPDAEAEEASLSPTSICRVGQDTVHRTLLGRAESSTHITLVDGADATSVDQDASGASVTLGDGTVLVADFVIAADGVQSTIRTMLGIELDGPAVLGYGQSIYWHGDLSAWAQSRPCVQFVTGDRQGASASVASVDGKRRWITMVMQPPGERPHPPTHDEAVAIVQRAVGGPVQPDIIDIATWRISAQVARSWRSGRVFLAGDAAHSFPPTGGFGMNTGVQDVHNLVWKLKLVLDGQAGDGLLDTYELERKPVARSNADWSVANGARMRDIRKAIARDERELLQGLLEDQRAHVHGTGQDLGFGYGEGALVRSDDDVAGPALTQAVVGHRFPATTLTTPDGDTSSVLHLKDTFWLVVAQADGWDVAVKELAAGPHTSVRLLELRPGSRRVLAGRDAVLVRPDGFVAWTGTAGADPAQELARVVDRVLR